MGPLVSDASDPLFVGPGTAQRSGLQRALGSLIERWSGEVMSSSDLYRIYRTKATHYAEMRNGWGSAPAVWSYLAVKFLGREQHDYLRGDGNDSELWGLGRDSRVPRELRLAHAFCFDQAMCPIERLGELAEACEEV